jgi:hypothetical protein
MDVAGAALSDRGEEGGELLGALALQLLDQIAQERAEREPRKAVIGEVHGGAGLEGYDIES